MSDSERIFFYGAGPTDRPRQREPSPTVQTSSSETGPRGNYSNLSDEIVIKRLQVLNKLSQEGKNPWTSFNWGIEINNNFFAVATNWAQQHMAVPAGLFGK